MRVLLVPDAFAGLLSAGEVAAAMARGWAAAAPGDGLDRAPLSDGGPGFVTVLHDALGGELLPVTVRGPSGPTVPGTVLLVAGQPADGLHRGGRGLRAAPARRLVVARR